MIDIVNYAYQEEGAILRLSEKSDDDSDRIFLVNRSAVYDENHNVIAGVAQVKFRLQEKVETVFEKVSSDKKMIFCYCCFVS